MLHFWHFLTTCLIFLWLCSRSNALCPSTCSCKQTDKGKRKVECVKGGMRDPIPIADMESGMEVLEISAPSSNRNTLLTIAPIFQQFKVLEEVHITQSNVVQISMHAFWGVPSLRLLNLTLNNISAVFDHNFRGLLNLVELNLDDNRIERLQSGAFKHLTELRILTLQRNLLEELVPRIFLKLAKLHVLKLSGNKFEELNPEVFKDIPDLRVLECRGCGLQRINTQIYHLLPYLSHIDLGNNQMQFLASDEFSDLHRLHSLKLDGNLLPVVLEKTFVNQQQLKYLCLARNRLAKITNTAFLNLTSLVELDISYNKLSKIEVQAVQHIADSLQRLVVSGNHFPVSVIQIVLNTLYRVWSVDLAQMKLQNFTEKFLPDRIRKLDISKNNLTELLLDSLPKQLQELDLSHNQLKGLNERLILKLEQLKVLNLQNNSWSCNTCHLSNAVILRLNKTKSAAFKNLKCASPKYLKTRLISSLNFDDLTNCANVRSEEANNASESSTNKLSLIIGLITLIILTFVSITFVVCSCMRRHAQNRFEREKRAAEQQNTLMEPAIAIFSKDEMKKDAVHQILPNGTGI